MWGVLKWNPAFLRKVFAAAGGPECPKPHLIPLFLPVNKLRDFVIYPFLGAFRTDSDGTFTVRFGVAIPHGRLQVSHIDPGGHRWHDGAFLVSRIRSLREVLPAAAYSKR